MKEYQKGNHNNDFRYDLKIGIEVEAKVRNLLYTPQKVEVKYDTFILRTRNIAIEYECSGKPSGISTTEADWWVFVYGEDKKRHFWIETELLKKVAREYYSKGEIKAVGDNNRAKVILIPLHELIYAE